MRLRPCIDIHNGKVKQIVGSSLADAGERADENFVAEKDASYYAALFRTDDLPGGHVILLNPADSPLFPETKRQALEALSAYPNGLMVGGGMNPETAPEYLRAGASHVIVTSYVFCDGEIRTERLREMEEAVGREHLVLDLSCRKRDGVYYIATDRWQKISTTTLTDTLLRTLAENCAEFLVHAVDVEGKNAGMDLPLLEILAPEEPLPVPVTYAGGVRDLADIRLLDELTEGRVDVTVGSALSLYGGPLSYASLLQYFRAKKQL